MEALKEEKLRCETLERELTSQKNCIDLILEEAKPKQSKQCSKGKHTEIAESNEIGNLKSEVGSLKSKVKILVEQAEAKNLEDVHGCTKNHHATKKEVEVLREQLRQQTEQLKAKSFQDNYAPNIEELHRQQQANQDKINEITDKITDKMGAEKQRVTINLHVKVVRKEEPETYATVEPVTEDGKLAVRIKFKDPTNPSVSVEEPSSPAATPKAVNNDTSHSSTSVVESSGSRKTEINHDKSAHHHDDKRALGKNERLSGDTETGRQPPKLKKETIKLTDHSKITPEAADHHNTPATSAMDDPPECSAMSSRDSYRINDRSSTQQRKHKNSESEKEKGFSRDHKVHETRSHGNFQKKKCLLIHDSTFEDFDQKKFSNQFDVTTFRAKKACIAAKSQKLKDVIEKEHPECIYVHLGLHDIVGASVDSTLCHFEELRDYLINSTNASICFSLVVPTSNSPELNKKINELNKELNLMITTARYDLKSLRDRLFTYNNSSVAWLNKKLQNEVHLVDRGKLVMWTKLSDGLRKTLRLPRPYLKEKSPLSTKTPQNNTSNG